MIKIVLTGAFILIASVCSSAQQCLVDKPIVASQDELPEATNTLQIKKQLNAVIAAPILKARRSLPQTKQRYLMGLESEEKLFLTARIFDKSGVFEQVFTEVRDWSKDSVTAVIVSDLDAVREYQKGQTITFSDKNVLDWIIIRPDGTEEGNFVGKYIASLQQ
ncbi:hypothetical protein [Hymenobacter sp. GOD-10R]|uniref:hypothetical protein n=1 Tax=Hymenobacter sp. GOD-10R TaxID=3093922 RepID=UPI002D77C56F|nr:hypothetical protein [Hymenobacter sp. GOD-10R]WRQ28877.1 hypothetical protein SD425_01190 [Hymenobacter sp. GOD-10R]